MEAAARPLEQGLSGIGRYTGEEAIAIYEKCPSSDRSARHVRWRPVRARRLDAVPCTRARFAGLYGVCIGRPGAVLSGLVRLGGMAWLALMPGMAQAATDLPGARDPEGIPRFPRSWVVAFEEDATFAPREFVVSAVEKILRERRIDQKLRIDAAALRVTYQVPAGTPREEVVAHYRRLLGPQALFSCAGRDCGRSNRWAHQVFGQAVLYGPDGNQFYVAADRDGLLVSAYVIERGNRRIYAHIEVLQPEQAVTATANADLTERLAGDGYSPIGGVRPRRDGTIPDEGVRMLQDIAPQLRIFERQRLYVVCHLYGPEAGGVLLERAGSCAEAAAEELRLGLAGDTGPELIPFGAGPLLPRADGAAARIELVLPHRQQRD